MGRVSPVFLIMSLFAKTSDGFPSRIILPDSHDDAAVGIHRLVHIMGYHDHRHALLLIEPFCNGDYLSPASRVKHGRCLVKHKTSRVHGKYSRNGYSLLLSARKLGRGVTAVF